jgi:hypothetical protein
MRKQRLVTNICLGVRVIYGAASDVMSWWKLASA